MLGQVIHGYRIDRALSEDKGGFGDVYFATHVDSGAEAVVKVLKPEMSALRDIVARFFNEARAAASIHHPGIVQIHNVGYHGDRAYLLMERLRGADLESRLERGPLPLDRAILFMRQAAGAIGAAHERGIVHRDLKPANLFVVEDPDVIGGERVKVLDFGIAKLTADSGGGKTQGVFGSPPYMSPEQCASTGAVDARSDLYSLGCIFYELVCGRPPFGHGGIELIASHLRDVPPPPRAIAHWVPPAIERVILALLEKQPDRRIPSCAALVAALDEAAAASGLPGFSSPHLPAGTGGISTAPPPRRPHTGHPATTLGGAASTAATQAPRRRLGAWLGIAAVVVVGGAVTAVMTLGGHPAGGPNPPQGASDGGIAVALVDAGASDGGIAVAPVDAALIAAVVPDAADTEATPPDPATDRSKPRTDKPRTDKPRTDPQPKAPTGERVAVPASSPSQAEIAARLNAEGKELLFADKPDAAIKKFQEAVARVPEAKYLFNLC
ncbi:MAG TPA: protein kinase, partial [Kofleriaceae bacterium]|nr:protein kinase [Kofleriaceae bacterium]